MGVSGDLTSYADVMGTATGTQVNPAQVLRLPSTAAVYPAGAALVVTAKTADFTGGVLKLAVHYWELTDRD